ncbi:hypothetical protein ACPEIC_16580 [Stenotrophomonas sp. NPDC087984]
MQNNRDAFINRITGSGLEVVDAPSPPEVPTPLDAWKLMASMETEPVATISQNDPESFAKTDRKWFQQASENSLFESDGTFLISVAGPGSLEFGWTRVRWSKQTELSSRLQDDGSPEFVGMSVDGRCICGVTTEEYDYWVVFYQFQ